MFVDFTLMQKAGLIHKIINRRSGSSVLILSFICHLLSFICINKIFEFNYS